ncbi:MAG TPA: hypothetical protein PKH77_18295 [Anaerolineae bacterium]|nr:hypothetical protein [Anaerolineae bacterium]
MTEAPPLSKIVAGFATGAQAAVALLDTFQPNLVLTLMHSGMPPLRVTQALWQTTHEKPFPPVAGANIGREKLRPYLMLNPPMDLIDLWFDLNVGNSKFLTWVLQETDWVAQLAQKIASSVSPNVTLQRILVLDDWVAQGFTQKLVKVLLTAAYPDVEIRHYATFANAWCDTLGQLWLRKLHPEVYRVWWRLAREAKLQGKSLPLYNDLCLLVPGTEDIAPDSLDWQPITAHSRLLDRLTPYLPAEEWLTLPAWAEATLMDHVEKALLT